MADDYRRPYTILFNAITDALTSLERSDYGRTRDILIQAQREAEEAYVSAGDSQEKPQA